MSFGQCRHEESLGVIQICYNAFTTYQALHRPRKRGNPTDRVWAVPWRGMAEPVLWPLDDHTQAKHRVLRAYLDSWIPVMGQQALRVRSGSKPPRLLLVDGFAGPGRYAGGEPGSPLIMLEALRSHQALQRLGDVQYFYLFIEHNRARVEHLRRELDAVALPDNVSVQLIEGEFETTFGGLVDDITERGDRLVPTFAFIDPFGYSAASMSLHGRFLDFARSEALFFLPLSYLVRFVGLEGQENALSSLFDTAEWREAIPLAGAERRDFLISLFERQLRRQPRVQFVHSFELHTRDGNDYRLVFATGHVRGFELMKEAMWRVDPVAGTSYVAHTDTGEDVLFAPQPNTAPLLYQLQQHFGARWFTIEEAAGCTLHETLFLPGSHLKRLTLQPVEERGVLEVDRPAGARARTYPAGTRLRFRSTRAS